MNSENRVAAPGKLFTSWILLLICMGILFSVYLTWLYYYVRVFGGGSLDTFCEISEGFNCVTVANSRFSSFFCVPVAIIGLEFFTALAVFVLMGLSRRRRMEAWDSLVFLAALLGLPICAILGYIAFTYITSVCIVCGGVYAVNFLLFLSIGLRHRFRFGPLFTAGPKLLWRGLGESSFLRVVFVILGFLHLLQFIVWPEIKLMAEAQSMVTIGGVKLPASGLSFGPDDAPIDIKEYTDYECPFCTRAHITTTRAFKKFPGKIHFTHKDYPLDHECNPAVKKPFHISACRAALYGRCAAKQGKYWDLEPLLFNKENGMSDAALRGYAQGAEMDTGKLEACLSSENTRQEMMKDIQEGIKLQLRGVPTYIINDGKEETVVGLRPTAFWERRIREILEKVEGKQQKP